MPMVTKTGQVRRTRRQKLVAECRMKSPEAALSMIYKMAVRAIEQPDPWGVNVDLGVIRNIAEANMGGNHD